MRYFLTFILLNLTEIASSQVDFQAGNITQLLFTSTRKSGYKWNARLENTFNFQGYTYERTDLELMICARTIGLWEPGGGVLLRNSPQGNMIRFIQQLSTNQEKMGYWINHRIRADQNFAESSTPRFRLRYRPSGLFALQGTQIDPREFYLRSSVEALGILQNRVLNLEARQQLLLGYQIEKKQKIELGIDNRNLELITKMRNEMWITASWFYTF